MTLLDFYLGSAPDHAGRLISDVWRFSAEELEVTHDYIQWLFPLKVPSPVNPYAPRLDEATREAFRSDATLQQNMLRSLDVMLRFYGLVREGHGTVSLAENFNERAPNYLCTGNHNHLRLTRIMHSLALCGFSREAQSLREILLEIARAHPGAMSSDTIAYWTTAPNV